MFPFKIDAINDAGEFCCYSSTFGSIELGGDVLEKGGYKKHWLRETGESLFSNTTILPDKLVWMLKRLKTNVDYLSAGYLMSMLLPHASTIVWRRWCRILAVVTDFTLVFELSKRRYILVVQKSVGWMSDVGWRFLLLRKLFISGKIITGCFMVSFSNGAWVLEN